MSESEKKYPVTAQVKEALENLAPEVSMEEEMRVKANAPLERMLDLAK